jgi:hypothetical protein
MYWGVLLKFINIHVFLFCLKGDKMMDTLYENLHVSVHILNLALNKSPQAVIFLSFISQVPGLNLHLDTDCFD